jgi:hypothetical protein
MTPSIPESGPSPQELQAAREAREQKTLSTQDVLRQETERLFRLYGASSALFGRSGGGKGANPSPLLGKLLPLR